MWAESAHLRPVVCSLLDMRWLVSNYSYVEERSVTSYVVFRTRLARLFENDSEDGFSQQYSLHTPTQMMHISQCCTPSFIVTLFV